MHIADVLGDIRHLYRFVAAATGNDLWLMCKWIE